VPTGSILVVDDEPLIRWALRARLERAGHAVIAAGSAREALARCGGAFDVAIVDLRLPDMDGLRLVGELKRRQPGCRVILITACRGPDVADAARDAGVFRILDKPFDLDALLATVEQARGSPTGAP
jgi:DNA-binding NtrC family response regulator